MPIEQYTESLVLQEMKCTIGENTFGFVFPQGDVSSVDKLEKLLKKAGGKPTACPLVDYSQGGNGKAKPEYVITFNKQPKTIIVVECKKTTTKHNSENCDRPKDYAVDGALYYAKFLKEEYNVVAIGVSGTKKDNIKVNVYYWQKNQETYTELKKARDIIYEPENYLRIVSGESVKKSISIEDIQNLALEMHESLRSLAVTERAKPVFIAGILIALKDDDFVKEYINLISFKSLLNRLQDAINNVLKDSDVRSDKIEDIRNHFTIIGKNTKLKAIPLGHYNSLSWYIEELEKKIKPMMDYADNTIDALGIFYHEFVKYSGGDGSGLGIVLTPQHLTEFMCDLAEINKNSKVVDICCGSGTFLVTAMGKMFDNAGGARANDKEIAKIRQNSLFGVESDDDIYTLAIANMIVRGDGKSNIIYGDCFNEKIKEELKTKNINIGLINPPYSQDITELEFVENMLDILATGGTGVVVVPMSCAIGTKFKETRERLFKKHTLKAVFSMPDDIFYSNNASTNVCVMVWEAHKPHDNTKNTFFGYYKNDGFVKAKKLGRIDKFNRWTTIGKEWVNLYMEKEIKEGLTAKKSVKWDDEWLCEAYMITDYAMLTERKIVQKVKNYMAYKFLNNHTIHSLSTPNESMPQFLQTNLAKLADMFEIRLSKSLELINCEEDEKGINFVSRTSANNGIVARVKELDFIAPMPAGAITVALSGSVLSSFYQEEPFYTSFHIACLYPRKTLTTAEILFYCAAIEQNKYRYNFGRQANKTLKDLLLPVSLPISNVSMYDSDVVKKIKDVKALQNWLYDNFNVAVVENFTDGFTIQCPCDASITIVYTGTDTISDIISKSIEIFDSFDANETFNELWGSRFAQHNHFTPKQFIDMLYMDEKTLRKIAYELRKWFD
ncbi:MAG: hypothetical protein Ta2A_19130 [Treponemataceae bacterium]|nr:MAG: hypothetical protein Ta2A_19130 [Treponemataceae bacterium]